MINENEEPINWDLIKPKLIEQNFIAKVYFPSPTVNKGEFKKYGFKKDNIIV